MRELSGDCERGWAGLEPADSMGRSCSQGRACGSCGGGQWGGGGWGDLFRCVLLSPPLPGSLSLTHSLPEGLTPTEGAGAESEG